MLRSLSTSLLSLATGSSASRCPRRKSLFPSGKNLSTIGYLTGGQFPNSQFTIIWASYESPACPSLDVCPPLRPIPCLEMTFFPCIPLVRSLNEFPVPGLQLARRHREVKCLICPNRQPYPIYLLRCQLK